MDPYDRRIDPHVVIPVAPRRDNFVDLAAAAPEVPTSIPRTGWICRVCGHQQVADWATHCEICETFKPRPGRYGEGFLKCSHCKFDNNYDLEECEMCGRPLATGIKRKHTPRKKKHKSKSKHSSYKGSSSSESSSSSSPSSSASSSDSSGRHRRSTRSPRRKSEWQSRSSSSRRVAGGRKPKFQRGEEIEAIPLGERDFQVGVVRRVHANSTYDVEFDSGQYEKNIDEASLSEISSARIVRASSRPNDDCANAKSDSTSGDTDSKFDVGDRIEARFQGGERFFSGTIKKCRTDGTYDIEYDDSEMEERVRSKYIKPLKKAKSPQKPAVKSSQADGKKVSKEDDTSAFEASFTKGQRVEVTLKGSSEYVKGKIFRPHLDGSCGVELDTGELEKHVSNSKIHARSASSPVKPKPKMQSDDEPIRPQRPIKKPAADATSTDESVAKPAAKFKQGQEIEAKFKGGDKYYPGVFARCRLNGSYDINYDDGEKESGVSAVLVRARSSGSSEKKNQPSDTSENDQGPKLMVGRKVEARFKGDERYYPGVISRCRLNGTYDIEYDDGENETGVRRDVIKMKAATASSPKKPSKPVDTTSESDLPAKGKFKVGQKVEAQYKGKSKYYPGVISRCRLNGTYDIDYDDGEKETGVAAELIRLKDSSSLTKKKTEDTDDAPKSSKKFKEGEKVEAQYKGKSKFYPGVISRCRLNGTYDIDYDDGEKETGVAAELIRLLAKTRGTFDDEMTPKKAPLRVKTTSEAQYRVGTRVEEQYMGKDKFFKGTISRAHPDGTYDIEYDDGNKENRVAARCIRPLKSSTGFGGGSQLAMDRPVRPSPGGGARRRSGNSSD